MFFRHLLLFLLFNLFIAASSSNLIFAEEQTENTHSNIQKRPAPPRRIPPNKVKPGGGLDFARQACIDDTESLTALIPVDNPVLTVSSHPSFLFYIPDAPSAMQSGEFSLFTADEKSRIYSTSITFEQTPGVIKIDLPPSEEYALEKGKLYHWYFKINCQSDANSLTYLDVNGWIKPVEATFARQSKIDTADPDIWYDAIAKVAEDLINFPQDAAIRDRWKKLLKYIDLEELENIPVIKK